MNPNPPEHSPSRPVESIFAPIGGHKNGCSLAEYLHLAAQVRALAPCRFLVFGVGRDSKAWIETNAGGVTLFLENEPKWIEEIEAEIGAGPIRHVDYPIPYEDWEAGGCSLDFLSLPETTADLFDQSWDVVFVDAPWGPTIGRHQSAFAATRAVRPEGLIALHDCDRDREELICRHVLAAQGFDLASELERLRLYRAPA